VLVGLRQLTVTIRYFLMLRRLAVGVVVLVVLMTAMTGVPVVVVAVGVVPLMAVQVIPLQLLRRKDLTAGMVLVPLGVTAGAVVVVQKKLATTVQRITLVTVVTGSHFLMG